MKVCCESSHAVGSCVYEIRGICTAQVLAMLGHGNKNLSEAAARILAKAGKAVRAKAAEDLKALESAKGKLLSISQEGTAKAAKAAVRYLHGASAQQYALIGHASSYWNIGQHP
jgi:hypothetical protein